MLGNGPRLADFLERRLLGNRPGVHEHLRDEAQQQKHVDEPDEKVQLGMVLQELARVEPNSADVEDQEHEEAPSIQFVQAVVDVRIVKLMHHHACAKGKKHGEMRRTMGRDQRPSKTRRLATARATRIEQKMRDARSCGSKSENHT